VHRGADHPADLNDITLILLGSAGSKSELSHLRATAQEWPGPKVLILYGASPSGGKEGMDGLEDLGEGVVGFYFPSVGDDSSPVPLKAMKNAGIDLVKTRYFLILEPGWQLLPPIGEVYRDIRISLQDISRSDRPGNALVLVAASTDEDTTCSIEAALPSAYTASPPDHNGNMTPRRRDFDADWFRVKSRQAADMVVDLLSPYGRFFTREIEEVGQFV